jgi:Tol biopolymer transport system component
MEGLGEFVLADADGANTSVWTEPVVGAFDWSPDGTQIAFDSVTYIPASSQLAIAAVDDANMPQNVQIIVADGVPTAPRWSPDGSLIAFKQTDPTELRSSLWLVGPDGSNPQQIAPEDVRSFDWSPDGTALVINLEQSIQIVSPNGDEPQTIAAGACPAWRPQME